jgi:hypothetical protein
MADRIELSAEIRTFAWYYTLVMATGSIMLGVILISLSIFGAVWSFMGFCFVFFGAIYVLRWRWNARSKRIEIEGDALYISDDLGRRDAVHLANVSGVGETGPLGSKRIRLSLGVDTRFGRDLEFRPQGWSNGPWGPQPIATFLKERIAAARVGIPPGSPAQRHAEQYVELQADMRRLREAEDRAAGR